MLGALGTWRARSWCDALFFHLAVFVYLGWLYPLTSGILSVFTVPWTVLDGYLFNPKIIGHVVWRGVAWSMGRATGPMVFFALAFTGVGIYTWQLRA